MRTALVTTRREAARDRPRNPTEHEIRYQKLRGKRFLLLTSLCHRRECPARLSNSSCRVAQDPQQNDPWIIVRSSIQVIILPMALDHHLLHHRHRILPQDRGLRESHRWKSQSIPEKRESHDSITQILYKVIFRLTQLASRRFIPLTNSVNIRNLSNGVHSRIQISENTKVTDSMVTLPIILIRNSETNPLCMAKAKNSETPLPQYSTNLTFNLGTKPPYFRMSNPLRSTVPMQKRARIQI